MMALVLRHVASSSSNFAFAFRFCLLIIMRGRVIIILFLSENDSGDRGKVVAYSSGQRELKEKQIGVEALSKSTHMEPLAVSQHPGCRRDESETAMGGL